MPSLGQIRKCERLDAFRVDHKAIPLGAKLHRYFMLQHQRLIYQMQTFVNAGSSSLNRYLSTPEWRNIDLSNNIIGLETDVMKMMVVLEAIFEHARTTCAPNLPSRLDCVFVCPTLELAKEFRKQYIAEGGVIHRCHIAQGEATELDGGLLPPGISLFDILPKVFSAEFQATQLRAEQYWVAKEQLGLSELLVEDAQ